MKRGDIGTTPTNLACMRAALRLAGVGQEVGLYWDSYGTRWSNRTVLSSVDFSCINCPVLPSDRASQGSLT